MSAWCGEVCTLLAVRQTCSPTTSSLRAQILHGHVGAAHLWLPLPSAPQGRFPECIDVRVYGVGGGAFCFLGT